ncbi:MAG TPA: hypothetical protein VLD67_08085 [Vicinamibacterales bacterium]|nr:hypothetical protein [Vicinamibacterales bacterium]
MMSAVVDSDSAAFSVRARRFPLDWSYPSRTAMRTHDVSPDGQRFLAIKTIEPGAHSVPGQQVIVIQRIESALHVSTTGDLD